jgi:hypothetical protein
VAVVVVPATLVTALPVDPAEVVRDVSLVPVEQAQPGRVATVVVLLTKAAHITPPAVAVLAGTLPTVQDQPVKTGKTVYLHLLQDPQLQEVAAVVVVVIALLNNTAVLVVVVMAALAKATVQLIPVAVVVVAITPDQVRPVDREARV